MMTVAEMRMYLGGGVGEREHDGAVACAENGDVREAI